MVTLVGVAALRGVTLEVPRGQFLIVLGTSGGGKTSLLNLIGTIDKPTKGSISVTITLLQHATMASYVIHPY